MYVKWTIINNRGSQSWNKPEKPFQLLFVRKNNWSLQSLTPEHLETFKRLLTNVEDNYIYLLYVRSVFKVCPLSTVSYFKGICSKFHSWTTMVDVSEEINKENVNHLVGL